MTSLTGMSKLGKGKTTITILVLRHQPFDPGGGGGASVFFGCGRIIYFGIFDGQIKFFVGAHSAEIFLVMFASRIIFSDFNIGAT